MGRRSRKRVGSPERHAPLTATSPPPVAPRTPRRRAKLDEAPKPPWAPFPLVELAILFGLGCLVFGFLARESERGRVLVGCGLALVCLASLEVTIREHVAGYRSHSALLAGVGAVIMFGLLFFAAPSLPPVVKFAAGVVVFVASFLALREFFRRRSGGLSFRA